MNMATGALLALALPWTHAAAQREHLLHATSGHDAATPLVSFSTPADHEVLLQLRGRMMNTRATRDGAAWLIVRAKLQGAKAGAVPGAVSLRIPLSSTGDAYGESRSCKLPERGEPQLVFAAGLDENNFVAFAATARQHSFRFLLNKYLCRALAASFHCGGREVMLPRDISRWSFTGATVELHSDSPAVMGVASLAQSSTAVPFDYARCAAVAPSNGICCVSHRTTEWHCGGSPSGDGWHQVSGDCYHRETGATCKE